MLKKTARNDKKYQNWMHIKDDLERSETFDEIYELGLVDDNSIEEMHILCRGVKRPL